jgi:hypothetical protein
MVTPQPKTPDSRIILYLTARTQALLLKLCALFFTCYALRFSIRRSYLRAHVEKAAYSG